MALSFSDLLTFHLDTGLPYQQKIDNKPYSMDTIDEQLDQANAKVLTLEGDFAKLSASTTELRAEKEQLITKNAELNTANSELRENLSHSQEKLSQSDAAQRSTLEENSQLKAAAKSAEEKAAEFYGAATPAVTVTAKGDPHQHLAEQFKAISDPTKQTEFIRSLNHNQRCELFDKIN